MNRDILSKVRKLNWVLQESPKGAFSFDEMCEILSELTNSNVYLTNPRGKVIGVHYSVEADSATIKDELTGIEVIPKSYNDELMKITRTKANLSVEDAMSIFSEDEETSKKVHTVIPVTGGGERWGTLVFTRYSPEFSGEDLVLGEVGATAVGLEIQRIKIVEKEANDRNMQVVKMAISTLSYSENEAVKRIFEELEGEEGILVASRIADKSSITRSVIVNALRKLESAGVIESRSLGMKGTHIKITNSKFTEYLEN